MTDYLKGKVPEGALDNAPENRSYVNAAKDRRGVEKIRFNIENLLSADNLMDNDSVAVLQENLNEYVHGEDKLKVDGKLGPKTLKSIQKYRNESRYWGGHKTIDIDPERTSRRYHSKWDKEDPREGGGDMGPF